MTRRVTRRGGGETPSCPHPGADGSMARGPGRADSHDGAVMTETLCYAHR